MVQYVFILLVKIVWLIIPCFESSGKGINRVGDDAMVGEGVLLSLFEGRGGDTSPISVSLDINRDRDK